jgi:hypothetical protein
MHHVSSACSCFECVEHYYDSPFILCSAGVCSDVSSVVSAKYEAKRQSVAYAQCWLTHLNDIEREVVERQ